MAQQQMTGWIRKKRRRGFLLSALYAGLVMVGGSIAFLLEFAVVYLVINILMLTAAPYFAFRSVVSFAIAAAVMGVFYIDSIHSSRDDMSFLPLWLLREYASVGPRAILEASRSLVEAFRFACLDVSFCEVLLSHLAWKNRSVSRDELEAELPGVDWSKVVGQLGLFDGVLVLSGASRITLMIGLRLELRGFQVRTRPEASAASARSEPAREPEPIPVTEPEKLSPWDILGVSASATVAEIKHAYRRRVKECHPDRFAGMDEQSRRLAEEWTKAVNAAYHTLIAQVLAEKRGR